jgi:hypothetical protein
MNFGCHKISYLNYNDAGFKWQSENPGAVEAYDIDT